MRHFLHMRHIARGAGMAAAVIVVVALVTCPSVFADDSPTAPAYPTWADVATAMESEEAKAAEVATVEAALQTAQADAAAKSQAALDAASVADQARRALDAATVTEQSLAAQAAQAGTTSADAETTLARLAATRYRNESGGPLTLRLLTTTDPDGLLDRLGLLERVSSTWDAVARDAVTTANLATSLHDQSVAAEKARVQLSQAADTTAAAARETAASAQAAVATTQRNVGTLYAQLAMLKDSTADVERQHEVGVQVAAQAAAQEQARQAAAAAAAAAADSSDGWSDGSSYPSTDGVTADPQAAQAYARGAIGGYGWDSGQFSCLVSLWNMESGWRADALNDSSGAYGIPQALPASKLAAVGADWRTNADTQIDWGLAYISDRYGSPCGAWDHEMSEDPHWY
ncbi:hypothetical protein [uncultured Microbacterium sp.]|uniref:aggregation-promoting factor C-terminal-like domain-containing protein n=1 Tax=uncultured Microbacterium sp. TaxID=191216 RepID=UPI0035CA64CF